MGYIEIDKKPVIFDSELCNSKRIKKETNKTQCGMVALYGYLESGQFVDYPFCILYKTSLNECSKNPPNGISYAEKCDECKAAWKKAKEPPKKVLNFMGEKHELT